MLSLQAIHRQLDLYAGWVYASDAHYPTPLPGIKVKLSPPNYTNCCAFVEGVIVPASGIDWDMEQHRRAMVWSAADRFGPVGVLCDAGIAWPQPNDDAPPAWSVCQGWRGTRGHTFIVAASDGVHVTLLEANKGRGLNGTGWRGVAPLQPGDEVPKPSLPWGDIRAQYPDLAVCSLRVGA